jgi:hypothetical protein
MSFVSKLNQRTYNQTTCVRDALARLDAHDCHVIDIQIGGHQPVITIEANAAALALGGATYMLERIRGQRVETYVRPMCGCQVRWKADQHQELIPPPPVGIKRIGEGLA